MEASEYANLAQVEERHWYYAGKRELVGYWLRKIGRLKNDGVLLDCGAGTGRFAQDMDAFCRVLVLDDHEEALRLLRKRFRPEQVIALSGDRVPLANGSLEALTALDVLEHVPDDAAVVREFARLLKPDGVVVVTVPASMALWSDWDVSLHHYRRYDRMGLRVLFDANSWDVMHINYTNVLVYPAVWWVRRWRAWFPVKNVKVRTEDQIPPPWLNTLLRILFVGLGKMSLSFPFGVSLILVARRRGQG